MDMKRRSLCIDILKISIMCDRYKISLMNCGMVTLG